MHKPLIYYLWHLDTDLKRPFFITNTIPPGVVKTSSVTRKKKSHATIYFRSLTELAFSKRLLRVHRHALQCKGGALKADVCFWSWFVFIRWKSLPDAGWTAGLQLCKALSWWKSFNNTALHTTVITALQQQQHRLVSFFQPWFFIFHVDKNDFNLSWSSRTWHTHTVKGNKIFYRNRHMWFIYLFILNKMFYLKIEASPVKINTFINLASSEPEQHICNINLWRG